MWDTITNSINKIDEKINSIASEISNKNIDSNNIGLLGGNSGLILFLFYYSRYSQNEEFENLGFELIEKTFDSINNTPPQTLFSGGLAGVGWTLEHLVQNNFFELDTKEILTPIDSALYKHMIDNIKNKEYDYLHGAMGYGLYFLRRPQSDVINNYLSQLVDELENTGIKEGADKIKWIYPFELKENKKTVYNLCLSHGIASIIAFLTRTYEQGINQSKSKELVIKSINYLLDHELDIKKHKSYFPSWVNPEEEPGPSRLAWCYGDMGIAITLWKAGKIFNNKAWIDKAIEILIFNTHRKIIEDTMINDPGICHGAAGIAHIFNRMFNYTGIEDFNKAADFWFNETLRMATFEDGLAGFKKYIPVDNKYVNSYEFLEGIAGIGLTLISAVSNIEPKWDECLLLS